MVSKAPLQNISKILVPIDGSESSIRAAMVAIQVARRYSNDGEVNAEKQPYSVEVIALYVIDVSPKFELFGKHGFDYSEYAQEAIKDARKTTERWFSRLREEAKSNSVRFRSEVKDNSLNSVVGEILDYAEKEHVDLIITGTRGQSQFKKLLIGSVSLGILTYAPCAVMIVR